MSAWIVALGLSAGYLVNKKLMMKERLEETVKVYQEAAKPANPGPTTEAIRNVQRKAPEAEKYVDMNLNDIDGARVKQLTEAHAKAQREVMVYEAGPPPIQGVYLNLLDRGV